jgi:hypothetical protein
MPSEAAYPQLWHLIRESDVVHVAGPALGPLFLAWFSLEAIDQLEAQGKLLPVAQSEISDFRGMRISGERESVQTVILRVTE